MSAQLGAAGVDIGAMEEAPAEEAVAESTGVETGNVSDETAHNDAMAKDAPLDIESTKETVAKANS
jgi:small subunit ribosomal protein S2